MTSLVKRLLVRPLPGPGRRRAAPDEISNEHRALQDLYEDADGSPGWRVTLIAFTASHLKRHGLSVAERQALRHALDADGKEALAALERLHDQAHGGAFDIRSLTRVSRSV